MDSEKAKRTTNPQQFGLLVAKMKEAPDIAKNNSTRSPENITKFWRDLKEELNSMGPPYKGVPEWKKVWTDFKSCVKKKLGHNKREQQATGGGPFVQKPLTSLEEAVAEITCLKTCVEDIDGNSFGNPRKRTAQIDLSDIKNEADSSPPSPKKQAQSQMDLLKNHVDVQKEFMVGLKDFFVSIKEVTNSINQSLSALVEEAKRHNLEIEKIEREKLEIRNKENV